jgi:hypothetical protein
VCPTKDRSAARFGDDSLFRNSFSRIVSPSGVCLQVHRQKGRRLAVSTTVRLFSSKETTYGHDGKFMTTGNIGFHASISPSNMIVHARMGENVLSGDFLLGCLSSVLFRWNRAMLSPVTSGSNIPRLFREHTMVPNTRVLGKSRCRLVSMLK